MESQTQFPFPIHFETQNITYLAPKNYGEFTMLQSEAGRLNSIGEHKLALELLSALHKYSCSIIDGSLDPPVIEGNYDDSY